MIVSQHVIDFCENWGVKVIEIPINEFDKLLKLDSFFKNPHNDTGICGKTIYVDENLRPSQNPNDAQSIVLCMI